jgi:TP901 family phage tail tape measure protein
MAKRISKQDIVGDIPNALDELVAKWGLVNTAILTTDEGVKLLKADLSRLRKEIAGIDLGSVKGVKEFNAKQAEAQKTMLATAKLEEQNIKLLQQKERLKQQELRTQKLANQESKKTLTAYQQESKALTEMRNRYKDLAVQKMKGVKLTKQEQAEFRRLLPQIRQTDEALKKIDASAGQFQRNVGNYPKVLGGVRNALGQLGVAFGAFQLAGAFGKTLVNFEEQSANMAKTLGVTVKEAKNLSRELATIDTRTSIEDLQGIASIGGQLGEGAGTIVAFTESIDKLNVALGDEFTGGAEEVTTVLGGLRNVLTDIKTGESATDLLKLGNALNVLGAEGTATSPVVADFASRISGIGIPLGLTSDEVLGLSATLQELNVNAERGGTAVGAILQRITRDTKGFAKLAGMPVKDFEELINKDLLGAFKAVSKGFSTLGGDAVKQSKVLEKLGLTGSGASEVFLKLGGSIDLLDTRVTQAGEALQNTDSITDEFNVKNNTLGATLDKVGKEFTKYAIGLDESGRVTGALSSTLQFLVDNMETVLNVVKQGVKAWITYKAVMTALNLKQSFTDWKNLGKGVSDVSENLKDGASNGQKFGQALKGVGWTAIIALAVELGTTLYNIGSGAEFARLNAERMNKALEKGSKQGEKISSTIIKNTLDRLKSENQEIDLLKVSDKEKTRLRANATYRAKKEIKENIDIAKALYFKLNAQRLDAVAIRDRQKANLNLVSMSDAEAKAYAYSEANVTKYTAAQKEAKQILDALRGTYSDLSDNAHDLTVEENNVAISTGKATKAKKEQTKAYKDANDQIERMVTLLRETQELTDEIALFESEQNLQSAIESQIESINQSGQYSLDVINARIQAEYDLRKAIIERQFIEQIDSATNEQEVINARIRRDFELGKLDEEFVNKRKEINKELEDAQEAHAEKISESVVENAQRNYDNERKWIELTTKFLEDQIDKRIALLEKESEAHKAQQDYFRALAESGNIEATQSLAEEARLQREADAEKAKLERRKQYIQVVSAFLTEYTNRIEKGESSTQAFTGALATKATLEALISSLPAFFEGTESTGKVANPLDSNGGRLSILHDDERVLPKSLNDQLGNMSNEELVKLAQKGKVSDSIAKGNNSGKSWDIAPLLKKLDSVEKAIENIPQVDYKVEETVKGVLSIIKTIQKDGNVTRNKTIFRS